MNEVIKTIEERRSCRKFKAEMPKSEDVDKVVEAGLYAANGMGKQETKTLVITDKKTRDKLSQLNQEIGGWEKGFDPFYGAPVVLVVLAPKDGHTPMQDGSAVIENMLLAAQSLGLGSCWINRAQETFEMDYGKELLQKLGIEGEWQGIGYCVLGLAEGKSAKAAPRKENRVYYVE